MYISCDSAEEKNPDAAKQWREYLGGPGRNHYSVLKQINASNVDQLEVVWEYHTKDIGQIQCKPIIVDGVLYGMTATTHPFAVRDTFAELGADFWTGHFLNSPANFTASKLKWVKENEPALYGKIHKMMLPVDYTDGCCHAGRPPLWL